MDDDIHGLLSLCTWWNWLISVSLMLTEEKWATFIISMCCLLTLCFFHGKLVILSMWRRPEHDVNFLRMNSNFFVFCICNFVRSLFSLCWLTHELTRASTANVMSFCLLNWITCCFTYFFFHIHSKWNGIEFVQFFFLPPRSYDSLFFS